MGIPFEEVAPGLFALKDQLLPAQLEKLRAMLQPCHLELIRDDGRDLPAKIEHLIVYLFQHHEGGKKIIISGYLCLHLHKNYNYLSNAYSIGRGRTIRDFVNDYKLEKIKAWLPCNLYSLEVICDKLQFSSVQYLCTWFKEKSGLTIGNNKVKKHNSLCRRHAYLCFILVFFAKKS
jgi:AraC-like DNA-binding protein